MTAVHREQGPRSSASTGESAALQHVGGGSPWLSCIHWTGIRGAEAGQPGLRAGVGVGGTTQSQRAQPVGTRTLTKSRDDEVSGAGSSPVLGGVNLLSSNFSFPELFTRKVEEQWQRPEGPPRPTAATRTAYHHQQAWGSEKEVRPGPHTQLRGNKLALKTGRADKTKDEVLTRSGEAWAKCTAEAIKCEVHRCTSVATRNPPAIQET
uniref:Uncharacterized protein n=1 Tax=Bos indicus x Bos taurus TaxID=30522 RepID=A0A4W2DH21_BOBOX